LCRAVSCILTVLSDRDGAVYRACCSPRRMQPLLLNVARSDSRLARSAAFHLLGRLP
jgi:hypothetical protein